MTHQTMHVEHITVTVRELIQDYKKHPETNQVTAYGGKLNIRPAYQREFIYKPHQQEAVIQTILKGFPLNIMYWAKTGEGSWEVLDGQQRTLSICEYCGIIGNTGVRNGSFSVKLPGHGADEEDDVKHFCNLSDEDKEKILNYKLDIYQCDGSADEKLDWFQIVNIAGEELTQQELRNSVYTGTWLTDAKRKFSRTAAQNGYIAKAYGRYLTGDPDRQEYLETALEWMIDKENRDNEKKHEENQEKSNSPKRTVKDYMADHQGDPNADALFNYFESVMRWMKATFKCYENYVKEMKGLPWGIFYNQYAGNTMHLNSDAVAKRVSELMDDDDVTNKRGIFEYILSGEDKEHEKNLHIRAFTLSQKRSQYGKQNGKCAKCGKECRVEEMEADHITPWSEGGHTTPDNLQLLCKTCNRTKSDK